MYQDISVKFHWEDEQIVTYSIGQICWSTVYCLLMTYEMHTYIYFVFYVEVTRFYVRTTKPYISDIVDTLSCRPVNLTYID